MCVFPDEQVKDTLTALFRMIRRNIYKMRGTEQRALRMSGPIQEAFVLGLVEGMCF